jgi:hypothetical protein
MKTNKQTANQNQNSNNNSKSNGLHRSEQSSTEKGKTEQTGQGKNVKPYVNYTERDANRGLPTDKVLQKLRSDLPEQYNLAEVVGKWVWITFPEIPADTIRAQLSQLGFHWNNVRKCWQHPCGQVTQRGTQDPREKYGSQFPADMQTA